MRKKKEIVSVSGVSDMFIRARYKELINQNFSLNRNNDTNL